MAKPPSQRTAEKLQKVAEEAASVPPTRRTVEKLTAAAEAAVAAAEAEVEAAPRPSRGVQRALRQETLVKARDAARAGKQRRKQRYGGIPLYTTTLNEASKAAVEDALRITGGNRAAAAEALGISRQGLIKVERRRSRASRTGIGGPRRGR